jgi:hypothetical protein
MNNPDTHIDRWIEHSNQVLAVEQNLNSGLQTVSSLKDYVSPQVKQDPSFKTIPGTSELPESDQNRIMELNRNTVVVNTVTGEQRKNPWKVSATPHPIAPAVPAIPTIAQVIGKVNAFGDSAADAVEHFEATKDDNTDHLRLIQLGEELAPLAKRVAELQAEVDAIKQKPKPIDKLIADVRNLTADYDHALSDAYQSVLEARSQKMFHVAYKKLNESTRADLRLGMADFDVLVARQRVRFRDRDVVKSEATACATHNGILVAAETLVSLLEAKLYEQKS